MDIPQHYWLFACFTRNSRGINFSLQALQISFIMDINIQKLIAKELLQQWTGNASVHHKQLMGGYLW